MKYQTTLEGITPKHLVGFFQEWPTSPDPDTLLLILEHSDFFVLAVNEAEQVIGLVNAITDKVFYAYIPLLEVLPDYQKQGIGEALIRRMKALLASFYAIDLCCDAALSDYYQKQGFSEVSGMILRNYAHQQGMGLQGASSKKARSSQGLDAGEG